MVLLPTHKPRQSPKLTKSGAEECETPAEVGEGRACKHTEGTGRGARGKGKRMKGREDWEGMKEKGRREEMSEEWGEMGTEALELLISWSTGPTQLPLVGPFCSYWADGSDVITLGG